MNLVYLINISYIEWENYSPQTIQIFSPELFKNQMKFKYVVRYLTHLVNDTYLNNTTLCQTKNFKSNEHRKQNNKVKLHV